MPDNYPMDSTQNGTNTATGLSRFPYGRWLARLTVDGGWLWVLMLLTHELGHGLAAWLTGGEVVSTDLRPGALGHTLVEPNPHPHWVVWGGFLSGCLLPLGAWAAIHRAVPRIAGDLRLLVGFCLLANGAYLAAGGGESLTDTGVLLSLGWPYPVLIAIGLLLAIPGYLLCRRELGFRMTAVRTGGIGWASITVRWLALAIWVAGQAAIAAAIAAALAAE